MDFLIKLSIIITLLFCSSSGFAQISPGELAEPHNFLEGLTNCTACHEMGKGPAENKCLDCHTNIKSRIEAKKGLHYQMVTVKAGKCHKCHSDHAGRDYNLIFWDNGEKNFDHSRTGYTLEGRHAKQPCRECHNPANIKAALKAFEKNIDLTRTYLGLSETCLNCHNDEHRQQLDKDCHKCHTNDKWKDAEKFNHNSAKFKLNGKHKKVDCRKCHTGLEDPNPVNKTRAFYVKYIGLKYNQCQSCHKDVHKGKFGKSCTKCHNNSGWNKLAGSFDHSKTKFPLVGKHSGVSCKKCHKSGIDLVDDKLVSLKKPDFSKCTSCHKDVHKNKFGSDCTKCHKNSGWKDIIKGSFDHSRTKYPLLGLHIKVACNKCHKTDLKSTHLEFDRCAVCHKDSHRGQFAKRDDGGDCKSCHNVQGFIPTLFSIDDHLKTKFPLRGAHLAQPCIACHKIKTGKTKKKGYRNFVIKDKKCEACHADVHFGQFAKYKPVKVCADCHSIKADNMLSFDHDKDAAYPLIGAHKKVLCGGCHTKILYTGNLYRDNKTKKYILYRPLKKNCIDCHAHEIGPLGPSK